MLAWAALRAVARWPRRAGGVLKPPGFPWSAAPTVTGLKENGTLTLDGDAGGVTLTGSSVCARSWASW